MSALRIAQAAGCIARRFVFLLGKRSLKSALCFNTENQMHVRFMMVRTCCFFSRTAKWTKVILQVFTHAIDLPAELGDPSARNTSPKGMVVQ